MYHDRFSCKKHLAAMALALGLCAGAVPASAGITEAEALRLGLGRAEFSELLRARVGEAEADALAADTWANPTLELEREKTGNTRETTWKIMQPLDLSGRRGLREDAARHRIRATESDNLARRNERAVELYRHFGFRQIGVRRGYYPAEHGREDALVLSRELMDEVCA